jgi:glycosyltransferase involved in cell wall biosynthesis
MDCEGRVKESAMSAADEQLRILAARLATREQVIESLNERLSKQLPDPASLRTALESVQRSRAYRLALALSRLAAPVRWAKRAARLVVSLILGNAAVTDSSAGEQQLRVKLDRPAPASVAVGRGNFLILSGWCYHPAARIVDLRLTRGGLVLDTPVRRYTRPDIFSANHPHQDSGGGSYGSGFFAVVDLPPCERETTTVFGLEVRLVGGATQRAELARIRLTPNVDPGAAPPIVTNGAGEPLVAICMATYNPPAHLFERQIESIRTQTHRNWICIITDDGSPPEAFARITALTAGDPRFHVYRNPSRLGFYHNFQRGLSLVPEPAEFVALADHDDDWRPEKLATLLAAFDAETTLVYSDMRVVTAEGECLSDTFWTTRGNNHTDIISLLLANTLTGAAAMFRRPLLGQLLPFPPRAGDLYHDQWLGCVAMALGKVGYVDRPLYDYVQHGRNALGYWAPQSMSWRQRLSQLWSAVWPPTAWASRLSEFGRERFLRYTVVREFARLLPIRCGTELVPARRNSLRWFAAAESSWLAWIWLAGRGLSRRRVSLGHEYALLASVWWRALVDFDGHRSTEFAAFLGRATAGQRANRSPRFRHRLRRIHFRLSPRTQARGDGPSRAPRHH